MDLVTTLYLLVLVIMISVGQVLFKLSSSSLPTTETLTFTRMLEFMLDPYFLAAIVTYAAGTLLWTSVLRSADLSRAYPVMALSFRDRAGHWHSIFRREGVHWPWHGNSADFNRRCGHSAFRLSPVQRRRAPFVGVTM